MVIRNDGDMGPAYNQQSGPATGLSLFEGLGTNESQDGDSEVQLWPGNGILLISRSVELMLTFFKNSIDLAGSGYRGLSWCI